MGEWRVQVSIRVSPQRRTELEQSAGQEKRTLANFGALLLEWGVRCSDHHPPTARVALSDFAQPGRSARLRHEETELRQILNLAPQLVAVIAPDEGRLYINQAGLDYYGLTFEEWRSCDPRQLFHPDHVERVRDERQNALASGMPFENELRVPGKDRKYRWSTTDDTKLQSFHAT